MYSTPCWLFGFRIQFQVLSRPPVRWLASNGSRHSGLTIVFLSPAGGTFSDRNATQNTQPIDKCTNSVCRMRAQIPRYLYYLVLWLWCCDFTDYTYRCRRRHELWRKLLAISSFRYSSCSLWLWKSESCCCFLREDHGRVGSISWASQINTRLRSEIRFNHPHNYWIDIYLPEFTADISKTSCGRSGWHSMSHSYLPMHLPSGKLTYFWKITIFSGFSHYKWPCSIAMSNYQRVGLFLSQPTMEPCCEPLKWTQPLQLPRAGSGEDFLWSQPCSFQDRERLQRGLGTPQHTLKIPLVMTTIAVENHPFAWENPLFLWPFSKTVLICQRVSPGFRQFESLSLVKKGRPEFCWFYHVLLSWLLF